MFAMLSAMVRWRSDRPRSAECRTSSTPFTAELRGAACRVRARTAGADTVDPPRCSSGRRPPVRGGLRGSGPLLSRCLRQAEQRLEGRSAQFTRCRPAVSRTSPGRRWDGTCRSRLLRPRDPRGAPHASPSPHVRRARPGAPPQADPRPVPRPDRQGHRGRPGQPRRPRPRPRRRRRLRHRQARPPARRWPATCRSRRTPAPPSASSRCRGRRSAIESGVLSEDLTENFSEVVNIMASVFNENPEAPHLKLYKVHAVGEKLPTDVAAEPGLRRAPAGPARRGVRLRRRAAVVGEHRVGPAERRSGRSPSGAGRCRVRHPFGAGRVSRMPLRTSLGARRCP